MKKNILMLFHLAFFFPLNSMKKETVPHKIWRHLNVYSYNNDGLAALTDSSPASESLEIELSTGGAEYIHYIKYQLDKRLIETGQRRVYSELLADYKDLQARINSRKRKFCSPFLNPANLSLMP